MLDVDVDAVSPRVLPFVALRRPARFRRTGRTVGRDTQHTRSAPVETKIRHDRLPHPLDRRGRPVIAAAVIALAALVVVLVTAHLDAADRADARYERESAARLRDELARRPR